MRILAISGSLRATSTNTRLVRTIMHMAPATMEFTLYEGLGDLPHFSPDIDGDHSPSTVLTLRQLLTEADGVLICTPEYAFGVPGVLKNALDWTVSTGDFSGKPTVAISASPLWGGGDKAHASLLLTLQALGAKVPEAGKLSIPQINKKLNPSGEIQDTATAQQLTAVLDALAQTIDNL
ncbi:FMN reductase [Dictyobacter alpinus]|uniref:FMN reductase n=1 Tax=Dictyobacter alpinus TaxID=2014873 RepID=A0A402BJZ7_9CHLR|nr:NADPH-dependent FMN reductase [Dictyobacter alpinus]GCE31664.1 FMN reductase [Dictyobacter alpinus]